MAVQVSTRLQPTELAWLDERRTVERRTRSQMLAVIVSEEMRRAGELSPGDVYVGDGGDGRGW